MLLYHFIAVYDDIVIAILLSWQRYMKEFLLSCRYCCTLLIICPFVPFALGVWPSLSRSYHSDWLQIVRWIATAPRWCRDGLLWHVTNRYLWTCIRPSLHITLSVRASLLLHLLFCNAKNESWASFFPPLIACLFSPSSSFITQQS